MDLNTPYGKEVGKQYVLQYGSYDVLRQLGTCNPLTGQVMWPPLDQTRWDYVNNLYDRETGQKRRVPLSQQTPIERYGLVKALLLWVTGAIK